MTEPGGDERRKDVRSSVNVCVSVDVPLALSYESETSDEGAWPKWQWEDLALSPDFVRAMVDEKDLTVKDPLMLQMLCRVDWLLGNVLKTLAKDERLKDSLPQFMNVNLSGSGIRFATEKEFPVESRLALCLILRPFIPIRAIGRVVRTAERKMVRGGGFETAVEFVDIAEDDREAIIRHVIRTQALTLRHRQDSSHSWVSGQL
ncbi:MAG: PilZ domain-containing protein [Nitrospirales bacterium]|nr:PilZ domain-containing protein [Nitrospira sp.]MDR4502379.1 PilZ domain-containing protein [Nitrospirales bacterium]